MPCLLEQDLVFPFASPSHQEAYTSLLASSIRGQTEEARRTTVPQKSHYRKLMRMEEQKVMPQMKGQDKTPEKTIKKKNLNN